MFQTFNGYLFDIKFNYTFLSVFYKAYKNGEESEDEFIKVKKRVLFNAHRCYRRISPKRFKKRRAEYDEIVQSLYDKGAFTKVEYVVEKWHMDYCKTSKRNYHKLEFDRE